MENLKKIKHTILVLSGKGGVGKSTTAAQLALSFMNQGLRVGILDVDICGPSLPKILGLEGKEVFQCSSGWVPVYVDEKKLLACMSIGFLLKSPDDAVVWRGPKKHAMIKQFLEEVFWETLDILIIDTPPGTSDEHITLTEVLANGTLDGAVLVTTPQEVSLNDVRKEISFCNKMKIPIIGIIENMSGFACPCCHEITYIFSKGGGESLSQEFNIEMLGTIPIDPKLAECEDEGKNFVLEFKDSTSAIQLEKISNRVGKKIGLIQ